MNENQGATRLLLSLLVLVPPGAVPSLAQAAAWSGIYTGQPSYAVGDTIQVHGSAPPGGASIQIRLLKLGRVEEEIYRSPTLAVAAVDSSFGSFAEFSTVDLSARSSVTIEGWVWLSLVGGDEVVIAGQTPGGGVDGTIALGVDAAGHLMGVVWTASGRFDLKSAGPIAPQAWHHLALTYDGSAMTLTLDGVQSGSSAAPSGALASSSSPFRFGASARAPGDLTGIMDGRLDNFAVWPVALSATEISARMARGLAEADPAPVPADVSLYVSFDEPYGVPLGDASANRASGTILHEGAPHLEGVVSGSFALELHHDQIGDAGWPVVASLPIPATAKSGFYGVQVLQGPGFDPADSDSPDLFIGVGVRPRVPTPGAKLAVILPVNTWAAYNPWPGQAWGSTTTPGITPRPLPDGSFGQSGNNSAYEKMADGLSTVRFVGFKRPNIYTSPALGTSSATGVQWRAPMSIALITWLEDAGIPFDVYTDWDLTRGDFPGTRQYRIMVFHGHDEYWSGEMLDTVHAFLDAGGSVLHLGGNAVTWRVVYTGRGAMEIHKWPIAAELGAADRFSTVDGQRIGYWRAIEQCKASSADVVLGTVNDQISSPSCDMSRPDCLGQWQVDEASHWLFGGTAVRAGDLFGTATGGGNTVGYETDRVVAGLDPPGIVAGSSVLQLAHGTSINGSFPQMQQDVILAMGCAEIDAISGGAFPVVVAEGATDSGSIAFYEHQGGGAVLGIASVATPSALSQDAARVGGDAVTTRMVQNFIDCYANDTGCPGGGTDGGADGGSGGRADAGPADGVGGGGGANSACGCTTTARPGSVLWGLLLLGALASRRRLKRPGIG